jgi:hypothetical protein
MIDLLNPEVTVGPRPTDPETSRYVRSYLIMRVFVGALGVALLPFDQARQRPRTASSSR